MSPDPALAGVEVVSMGQVIAAPVCSALLADLGADVIKVESSGGDSIRSINRDLDGAPFSPIYETYNRNKRGICLDVHREEGLSVFYELIETADVFVHNFKPGVSERLEIDEDSVREYNDGIVYASISGYGESGELAQRPAFDTIVQHTSGFSSFQGYEEDPPMHVQTPIADYLAGYNAAVSILAALYNRDALGGDGQKAEITLFESLIYASNGNFELYNNVGEVPEQRSRGEDQGSLYGPARTQDDWIAVAFLVGFPNIWQGFCELVDEPDRLEEERFQNPATRAEDEQVEELNALLRDWLQDHTADEAVEILNEYGIPAAHYRTIPEVVETDHVDEQDVFAEVDHPLFGSIDLTGSPFDLSKTPPSVSSHSPMIGEHTDEILSELGYSADEREALATDEVVVTADE